MLLACLGLSAACTPPAADNVATTKQAISIYPYQANFPQTEIGKTSSGVSFTLYADYDGEYAEVTAVNVNCPDFFVNAPLPGYVYYYCDYYDPYYGYCYNEYYESYTFQAFFRPTIAGPVSCVATVHTTAGNYQVTLSGTGTVPPVKIDVQPSSLAFGDVRRGSDSDALQLTVRNQGGMTMTVSSMSITGTGASAYAMVSGATPPYTVAPNGSSVHTVRCNPATTGAKPATLTIASNDPATPNKTVPLSCNGIDSNLALSPSPAVFTTTRVGEPVDRTITIANSGAATSTLDSVSVTGDMIMMAGPSGPLTLAANGGSTTVQVRFPATAKGEASGMLVVMHDGGQQRTAQLSATALATSMSMNPDGLIDFGPMCVGQRRDQEVMIRANEEGPFVVQQVTGATAPFEVTTPSLPAQVEGNGANDVTITVAAEPSDAGRQTATVTVATDIPAAEPRELSLVVTGLPAGVSGAPDTVDFGARPIEQTTIGQQVHLANCDADGVNWSNARIEGRDASEFAIVSEPSSASIGPTETATWLIVMQAKARGPKEATFAVDHDGGTATVFLTGLGVGGDDEEGDDRRGSYYSCSAGAGGSGGLVLLGLALLGTRRRRTRAR
jgi:MYXO-CTERM domain-containing protein